MNLKTLLLELDLIQMNLMIYLLSIKTLSLVMGKCMFIRICILALLFTSNQIYICRYRYGSSPSPLSSSKDIPLNSYQNEEYEGSIKKKPEYVHISEDKPSLVNMRSHVFVMNLNKNQSKVGKDEKRPLLRCRSLDAYHVPITAAVGYQLPITSDYTTISFRGDKIDQKNQKNQEILRKNRENDEKFNNDISTTAEHYDDNNMIEYHRKFMDTFEDTFPNIRVSNDFESDRELCIVILERIRRYRDEIPYPFEV